MPAFEPLPQTPSAARRLLDELGVRPSKRRGQSFLVQPEAAARIAALARLSVLDSVLEIGPGLGALTGELLKRAGRVTAIESDPRLVTWLRAAFGGREGFTLLEGDALKLDLAGIVAGMGERVKVVSNIPYSISGPLIGRLLEESGSPSLLVLTLQRELARRITASPGGKEYGSFTVFCRYYAETEVAFDLAPSVFFPRPGVVSSAVVFKPKSPGPGSGETPGLSPKEFFRFVKMLFSQRRKAVGTVLRGAARRAGTAWEVDGLLERAGVARLARPEELGMDRLAALHREYARISDAGRDG